MRSTCDDDRHRDLPVRPVTPVLGSVRLVVTLTSRRGAFERLVSVLARKNAQLRAIDGRVTGSGWTVSLEVAIAADRLGHVLAALAREVDVVQVDLHHVADA